ncbi:MAG: hypothetical protein NTU88_10070 [Armatimonadetes bacterium]|nr:hypothetical protein [Armatimonadota bacterium]
MHDPNNGNGTYGDCTFTTLTAQQARGVLINAGCKVYIDAGDGQRDNTAVDDYTNAQLYVNGAMENTSYGTYTFPKLKAALGM